MSTVDFRHLSPQGRIALIGELCQSLEDEALPLSPAVKAELDPRIATLDADAKQARSAGEVLTDLRRRYC